MSLDSFGFPSNNHLSKEQIYFTMIRAFTYNPDLPVAMNMVFENLLEMLDKDLLDNKPPSRPEFSRRVGEVCRNWADASISFNKKLYREGSKEFVDLNGFQVSLRAKLPEFYWKLLLSGLDPLPDEKFKVSEAIAALTLEQKRAAILDSKKRHKGSKNGRIFSSN